MADKTISALTATSSLNSADVLNVVQSGVNKKITYANLLTQIGANFPTRWTEIPAANYTAPPASTSTVTMSATAGLVKGLPLKYTYDGNTYYGMVRLLAADSLLTVNGAPLVTAKDLTYLGYGNAEMISTKEFFVASTYGDGVASLLSADNNSAFEWSKPNAYIVQFRVKHKTDDTGANQPKINLLDELNNVISTNDSNNGIQVSTSWQWNSAVAINTTNYVINFDELLEIKCTAAGSNSDAADLSVQVIFVVA